MLIFILSYLFLQIFQVFQTNSYFKNPQKGDIYLFQSDSLYYTFLIEVVKEDSIFFYGYENDFINAPPNKEDLDLNLFDHKMLYIYDVTQLNEFKENKKIIKIFR